MSEKRIIYNDVVDNIKLSARDVESDLHRTLRLLNQALVRASVLIVRATSLLDELEDSKCRFQ